MTLDRRTSVFWKINDVLIDLSRNIVTRLSEEYRLEPKVASVLAVLIDQADQVVSRQELLDKVWENIYGADQSLTNAISQLRKILDREGDETSVIETVPKRGYRLVADAVPVGSPNVSNRGIRSVSHFRRLAQIGLLLFTVAISLWISGSGNDERALFNRPDGRPASHLSAFEAYQRGQQAFAVPTTDNLRRVIGFLEQAVAQDPQFAAGWAELAVAYHRAPSWLIRDRDYHSLAKQAAENALAIDPDQPLAHAVLGVIFVEGDRADYSAAIAQLTTALEIDPTNRVALQWRGIVYTAVGFFDQAHDDLARCVEAHPDNGSCIGWLSFSRLCAGDTQRAFELFESAAEAGIRTHLGSFAKAYAAEGQRARAILTWAWDFSGQAIDADRLYRAHTDPNFDFETEAAQFAAEYAAANGRAPDWGRPGAIDAAHTFKRYDDLEAAWWYPVWWLRMHDDFIASEARSRLMDAHGLFDYWDAAGHPDHCINDQELRYICD